MLKQAGLLGILLVAAGCTDSKQPTDAICRDKVLCGFFEIAKTKESTPVFFPSQQASPVYRLCVSEGSIILQTIEADGNALALGGEIRSGNCTEVSFSGKIHILGNTAAGVSKGFYYSIPR